MRESNLPHLNHQHYMFIDIQNVTWQCSPKTGFVEHFNPPQSRWVQRQVRLPVYDQGLLGDHAISGSVVHAIVVPGDSPDERNNDARCVRTECEQHSCRHSRSSRCCRRQPDLTLFSDSSRSRSHLRSSHSPWLSSNTRNTQCVHCRYLRLPRRIPLHTSLGRRSSRPSQTRQHHQHSVCRSSVSRCSICR